MFDVFFLSDGGLKYCQRERARRFYEIRVFMLRARSYGLIFLWIRNIRRI